MMANVKATSWKIMLGYWAWCVALAAVINLVLFRGPWFDPIARATAGLVNVTFQANAISLLFFGLVVFGLAKLRPRDVGLEGRKLLKAVTLTAAIWVGMQAAAALAGLIGGDLRIDPLWSERGVLVVVGLLIGQAAGNALFEELLYRGFLLPQLFLKISAGTTKRRMVTAVLAMLGLFILSHIPNRIYSGYTPADIPFDFLNLAIIGTLLTLVYILTGNLFLAVGVHALINAPTMIVATNFPPQLILLGLIVVLLVVWWRQSARRAAVVAQASGA